MKSAEFQAVAERMDELLETRRAVIEAASRSKGSTNDALALIETQFAADSACGHCGSNLFGAWGHASGLRRYKCMVCCRTFNALTGTPLTQLHKRDVWGSPTPRARRSRESEEGGQARQCTPGNLVQMKRKAPRSAVSAR